MKLVLTSIGQDTELDTGENVHTLTFNNGKLRICVSEKEINKLVEFIKSSAGITDPSPQATTTKTAAKVQEDESFYIEPNLNQDNQIWRDPYAEKGIGSGIAEDDMTYTNGQTDEEGAIEF